MGKDNILMIVENCFPADPRVKKEVDTLRGRYGITVIALKKRQNEKFHEEIDGVSIFRLPEFLASQSGKLRFIAEYLYFTAGAAFLFMLTYITKKYKVVHVHNPPDTLFAIGLLAKLLSVKFVFDHHDLSPELYLVKFSGAPENGGLLYRTLVFLEKMSCKLADAIICTNESFRQIEMERHNINEEKIYLVRNDPVMSDFLQARGNGSDAPDDIRNQLLFLGSINPQDGLDVLLKALEHLIVKQEMRDFVCIVVGGGDALNSMRQLAGEMDLDKHVIFTGPVYDRRAIADYLSRADICVEPAPYNCLNDNSTFIKVMEYMVSKKPVVAFDLKETRYSAGGSALLVPPGDVGGFALAIKKLIEKPELRKELGEKGLKRIKENLSWEKSAGNLLRAYESLTGSSLGS